jgi:hypothetical protein
MDGGGDEATLVITDARPVRSTGINHELKNIGILYGIGLGTPTPVDHACPRFTHYIATNCTYREDNDEPYRRPRAGSYYY